MNRYVALLRGINVGGHKKVPMAQLRALLEAQGFEDVVTLLQSGNAVFGSKKKLPPARLERQLEEALEAALGFEVEVLVRTRDELAAAIAANPLPGADEDPSRFAVTFLSAAPEPKRLAALDPAAYAPDEFRVVGRELYARFPQGMGRSKLAAVLSSTRLGVTATARNWGTVTKLLALADAAPATQADD
ncbi:DUF1697 domain-containing protein [Aggregicoccus sp. 17bor-14]|uniref:DUF1697 domain-containing protein n=1 Tax=Myxococcaceae TaxID=31 RepID=UPI00129C46B8|nr:MULTISPECIES: DUF1697 domain-containing protein [Myxococcaceae]MBF5040978.1 DUF1697 domain-containing protein [Simulacricoccus sp. 17bor-14]MRI86766.1 DUF1697 domain-containing protein [Aggregicoccus sp. 17bor-14]